MSEPFLSAEDVHRSYQMGRRRIEVLRGVDLAVARGEFIALRGASGAGKSTLLHLLGGLDLPNKGRISIEHCNLASLGRGALARLRNRRIGLVFQAYHLFPELTALENVCVPARLLRTSAVTSQTRATAMLERVGLADRLDHRPYELSGGEQQRVAIARALINEPDVLLADEPTGNLDSHTGEEIIELLCALWRERKTTLIIATHDARWRPVRPEFLNSWMGCWHPDLMPTDWEYRYQTGDTSWEKGAPSPGLVDFLDAHSSIQRGSVLVPGCGTGHDARAFAKAGFAVTGLDIAPVGVRLGIERTQAAGLKATFLLCDFLRDPPTVQFDWLFEHTLFCAIDPPERDRYVAAVLRWLKPDGHYLAVNYFIPDQDGPPFGTDRDEIWRRFSPHFDLLEEWVPRSYPNRMGKERMFWWRRKPAA